MARLDLLNDPIKHNLYTRWSNMIQRCSNPKDPRYHVYGARGIRVCKRWLSFDNFYIDMSSSFKKGLTLDRINTDRDYSKDNCRWVTQKVQQNNRTNNRIIQYKGVRGTLQQWAELFHINQSIIWGRLYKYHWSVEKALETKTKTTYYV